MLPLLVLQALSKASLVVAHPFPPESGTDNKKKKKKKALESAENIPKIIPYRQGLIFGRTGILVLLIAVTFW